VITNDLDAQHPGDRGDLGGAHRTARRVDGDRGAAIVEMALVMPLVLAIVLATISSGVAMDQRLSIDHAVRESARYGATVSSSQLFTDEGSWAANVSSVATARAGGALDVPGATLCVSLVEGSGAGGVHVVSGPYPASSYTTKADGKPCDPSESYPTTLYDVGRRVQVRATRPARIEIGLDEWEISLSASVSVKSESSS
jgi:hypothetical protein